MALKIEFLPVGLSFSVPPVMDAPAVGHCRRRVMIRHVIPKFVKFENLMSLHETFLDQDVPYVQSYEKTISSQITWKNNNYENNVKKSYR